MSSTVTKRVTPPSSTGMWSGSGSWTGMWSGSGSLTYRGITPTAPQEAEEPLCAIAYYPEAFSPGSRRVLAARLYPDAVLATRQDAMAFGLNSVSDGRHVFIAPRAKELADQL